MLLFTYFILFVSVAPLTSCGGWTRKRSIHSNYSRLPATTTLQEIEVNQSDKQACYKWY